MDGALHDGERAQRGDDPERPRRVAQQQPGAKDDDALRPAHEADVARHAEALGAGAQVADHERGGERAESEVGADVVGSAYVVDEQPEQDGDLAEAVEDRVQHRAERRFLAPQPGDRTVVHIQRRTGEHDDAALPQAALREQVRGCGRDREAGGRDGVRVDVQGEEQARGRLDDEAGGPRPNLQARGSHPAASFWARRQSSER